jgi:hypothetical protein
VKAEEYRRLARDCLEMARATSTEQARMVLVDQAQLWLRLAEEQEAAEQEVAAAPAPAAPDEARPPVQLQQQQIQPKKNEDQS